MITIPADEARGFDELSIATLKAMTDSSSSGMLGAHLDSLIEQLGMRTVDKIMASPEYAAIVALNRQVFEAINRLAEEGPWPGGFEEINGSKGLNHQRWLAKRALQQRFFPKSPLTERKVGYGGKT